MTRKQIENDTCTVGRTEDEGEACSPGFQQHCGRCFRILPRTAPQFRECEETVEFLRTIDAAFDVLEQQESPRERIQRTNEEI